MPDLRWQYRQLTDLAPERYNLYAEPLYQFTGSRREFLQTLGAGLLFVFTLDAAEGDRNSISSRLHLSEEGVLTVLTGKMEMGQGIRTSLAQIAAEEMQIPLERVRVLMGDTDLTPDDGGTWGSLTTPQVVPQVRQACAALLQVLQAEAQKRLNATVRWENARFIAPNGKTLELAQLASAPLSKAIPNQLAVRDAKDWNTAGRPAPNTNGIGIVTGAHRYPSDLRVPGMLYGAMVRPQSYGARLRQARPSESLQKRITANSLQFVLDSGFAGVIAPTQRLARMAAAEVEAQWDNAPLVAYDALSEQFRSKAEPPQAGASRYPALIEKGNWQQAPPAGAIELKTTHTLPYIAHVPLEPRAAVAEWTGDKLTVHSGTQAPFLVRQELARAFGIPEKQIRVIVHDAGSGYGGKQRGEVELEAARLAKAAGKPVKVAWTRQEEFEHGYFRPAGLIEIESAVHNGSIVRYLHRNYNSGAAGLAGPYDFPNHRITFQAAPSPLRQGSYRSLAAAANNFARETHIDEVAGMVKVDAVEFRLRHISDKRLRKVVEVGAERFGWGKEKGQGVAVANEKGGRLALFVHMESGPKSRILRRVLCVFEAGPVINPDILENQVAGAIIQGLGGALFEEVRYDANRLLNARLRNYRVPRFSDVPPIEVILLPDMSAEPAGAGEAPLVGIAPAIANAYASLTGKRVRNLPLEREMDKPSA